MQTDKSQRKKFYLTREGLKNLKIELKNLLEERGVKIKNPDEEPDEIFILNKKIEEIENVLKNFELIVPPPKEEQGKAALGATVTVSYDGHTSDLTIVGTLEANPPLGKVSNESPVGKSLVGKKVNEIVLVNAASNLYYKIKKIRYGEV